MATLIDRPTREQALARLRGTLGEAGLVADAAVAAPYLADERGIYQGQAAFVARPATTEHVALVVKVCGEAGLAVVPQGGNTGMCGGGVPDRSSDCIVLSLSRLKRIRAVDTLDYTITVEAGCVLADVQRAAEQADRFFPLSLAAEGSCQIGGNLSTNAGGIQVLRWGMARDLVLGLEVVLPDGRVWNGLSRLRKDNTGYDLKQMFIGAEGTLGVITAATLKLFARPRRVETAFVAVPSPAAAIDLLARLREGTGEQLSAFELISGPSLDLALAMIATLRAPLATQAPWYVLCEATSGQDNDALRTALEGALARAIEDAIARDATLASSSEQRQALWRLREELPEAQRRAGAIIRHDISVPLSRVAEFLDRATKLADQALPGARVAAFGHAGDGNIHFNLVQPPGSERTAFLAETARINRLIHDLTVELEGSISAEHGIGQSKRAELGRYHDPLEIELMRRLKKAFDPLGLMNPGKVLP